MSRRDLSLRVGTAAFRQVRRFIRPRYVILHGYYGAGNVGDEAVLLGSLEQLRELPGGVIPFVFCKNPELVSRTYNVPSLDPLKAGRRPVARVLLRSSAYLLGGGGLLKDYGRPEVRSIERQWLQWLKLAQSLGVKTMLWSVGVENLRFDRSKEALRAVLPRADVVIVRDEASEARLRTIGFTTPIHVTADPVPWLAQRHARPRSRPTRPRVVVSMRHWYPYDFCVPDEEVNERMLAAVAYALDDLVERCGAEVVFVPFRTTARDDDREACRAVQVRMRANAAVHDEAEPGVRVTMERIAEADLVIGMRLHASIMATAMGVPTVALSYMPKVRDFMATVGQEDFCIDVEDVTRAGLVGRVEEVLNQYEERSRELLARTARAAKRFEHNRKLLEGLLQGVQVSPADL